MKLWGTELKGKAKTNYDNYVKLDESENIVFFLDQTIMENAKKGVVATENKFFKYNKETNETLHFDEIESLIHIKKLVDKKGVLDLPELHIRKKDGTVLKDFLVISEEHIVANLIKTIKPHISVNIQNVAGTASSFHFSYPDKPKIVENLESFFTMEENEKFLFFKDDTVMGSGKDGTMFTDKRIFRYKKGKVETYTYDDIKEINDTNEYYENIGFYFTLTTKSEVKINLIISTKSEKKEILTRLEEYIQDIPVINKKEAADKKQQEKTQAILDNPGPGDSIRLSISLFFTSFGFLLLMTFSPFVIMMTGNSQGRSLGNIVNRGGAACVLIFFCMFFIGTFPLYFIPGYNRVMYKVMFAIKKFYSNTGKK